ncbi:prolyl oligopeptidase family serine peptidase [Labilibaculum sp. A4]|uniref:prolyl oligopeptidase family serine peptidase n=1 Tax=Labilibaculum euxinus TaxID=2686357 RepID=UPI000F6180B8|nr:prolyl oligopeptidase family serine peptidase [Labilibaculum euxinus]MDQ1770799.1 prolyl oligopeptidase family serine peptidase [Labilibaculum euxinus]MWN75968.1 prolyl oligopeptidase family serine peptidase [Labilibaculum euxinus]
MKHFLLVIICLLSIQTLQSQQLEYPTCPKQTVVDTFFNQYPVSENYRWMEDIRSPEVEQWIKDENKISQKFLRKASIKYNSKASIKKYGFVDGFYATKKGKYYFDSGRRNKLASSGLYIGDSYDNINQLLIDPNFKNGGDKVNITGFDVSRDSEKLVYMINRNGTDWREIKVVGLPSGKEHKDHLKGIKYSSVAWKGDGFFYSQYPYLGEFYAAVGEEVYFHKLGDTQEQDKLIFKRKNPTTKFSYVTTSNERYFILEEETTNYFNYFFIDYQSEKPYLRPLLMKQKASISVIDSQDGELIATTGKTNGGSVVAIDPYNPFEWRQIVPELNNGVLLSCITKTDRIIVTYQSNQHPILKVFDYSGKQLFNMNFLSGSSISGFNGEKEDENLIFYREQYTMPSISYHFNVKTFDVKYGEAVNVVFNFKNYETKSIKYPVNDSISIPMNLVYKKGLKLDGNNPCLLKAYGGFGSISTPHFNPGIIHFIEKGGVYAYANIRGGGDLGMSWARAGKRLNKQNTIDDFNAATEYLIKEGYSSANKMACTGGSHGGLVVAAAAIQRPDLYAAVVPVVAVTDMLRFEQFTVGVLHKDEFGTVADSTDFLNLRSYSPLHNIKEDVNYPAMLVMTSENDDRVPPLHSYKFVAQLQNRKAQTNPILLRVEKDAGHYGGMNYYSRINSQSNLYDFIFKILLN